MSFKVLFIPNHSAQTLRSVLWLFSLGKLKNHFSKVRSNPIDGSKHFNKTNVDGK